MVAPAREPVGLPLDGPADLAAVKSDLRLNDSADDEILHRIIAAVNALVRSWPVAAQAADPETDAPARKWPAHIVQGATMLAGRLYRRRNSPAGFESFADTGAVYVQRNDPDIALLLHLGTYTAPAVG